MTMQRWMADNIKIKILVIVWYIVSSPPLRIKHSVEIETGATLSG